MPYYFCAYVRSKLRGREAFLVINIGKVRRHMAREGIRFLFPANRGYDIVEMPVHPFLHKLLCVTYVLHFAEVTGCFVDNHTLTAFFIKNALTFNLTFSYTVAR